MCTSVRVFGVVVDGHRVGKGVGDQTNSRSPQSQYIRLEVREYELLTCYLPSR